MQGIIRGSSDMSNKLAHDKNNINANDNIDNNSNINDSSINDIQSLSAKNQKRNSIASKHLHADPTTTATAARQARISSSRTARQAMTESRNGVQQHNNTNDDDRTNVEWQESADHREDS